MGRTAAQVFLLFLVMLVAGEECDNAGHATSTALRGLTQEELVMSVIVNQRAILKDMNESSCFCDPRNSELRELRMMKEEIKGEVEIMKEIKGELETMMEEVKGTLETMDEVRGEMETMKEEMKRELEAMKEEVEGQLTAVKEMLGAVRNTSIITPSQQPDPPASETFHNDTDPSLCGPNKVLYGSRGSLSPSHPSYYDANMRCKWRVILPEGTHPVFRWEYIRIESASSCHRDFVRVNTPRISDMPPICGRTVPSQHPMYSITDNEFTVTFSSNSAYSSRGFLLHYKAEINQVSA